MITPEQLDQYIVEACQELNEDTDRDDPYLLFDKCRRQENHRLCWPYYQRDYLLSLNNEELVAETYRGVVLSLDFLRGANDVIFDPDTAVLLLKRLNDAAQNSLTQVYKKWLPEEIGFLASCGLVLDDMEARRELTNATKNAFAKLLKKYTHHPQTDYEQLDNSLFAWSIFQMYATDSVIVTAPVKTVAPIYWAYKILENHKDKSSKVLNLYLSVFQNQSSLSLANVDYSSYVMALAIRDTFRGRELRELLLNDFEYCSLLRTAAASFMQVNTPYLNVSINEKELSPRELTTIIASASAAPPQNQKYMPFLAAALNLDMDSFWKKLTAEDWLLLARDFDTKFKTMFKDKIAYYTTDSDEFLRKCKVLATPFQSLQLLEGPGIPSVYLKFDWPSIENRDETKFGCQTRYAKNKDELLGNPNLNKCECSAKEFISKQKFILSGGPGRLSECYNLNVCLNWRYSFGAAWNDNVLASRPRFFTLNRKLDIVFWTIKGNGELVVTCDVPTPQLVLKRSFHSKPISLNEGDEILRLPAQSNSKSKYVIPDYQKKNFYNLLFANSLDCQRFHLEEQDGGFNVMRLLSGSLSLKCPYCFEKLSLLSKLSLAYQCKVCKQRIETLGKQHTESTASQNNDDDVFKTGGETTAETADTPKTAPDPNSLDKSFRPSLRDRLLSLLPITRDHHQIRCPICKDPTIINPLCPHCQVPLPPEIFRYDGTVSIVLLGVRNSGKTTYHDALVKTLQNMGRLTAVTNLTLETNIRHEEAYEQFKLPNNTLKQRYAWKYANVYSFKTESGKNILISLLDVAGEELMEEEANGGMQTITKQQLLSQADGFITIVDPTGSLNYQTDYAVIKKHPIPNPQNHNPLAMIEYVNNWITRNTQNTNAKRIPMAIAMSKLDMLACSHEEYDNLPAGTHAFLPADHQVFSGQLTEDEKTSFMRRQIQCLWPDSSSFLNTVESLFSKVEFFGFSSLGFAPTADLHLPSNHRNPFGILDPFEWLLKEKSIRINK